MSHHLASDLTYLIGPGEERDPVRRPPRAGNSARKAAVGHGQRRRCAPAAIACARGARARRTRAGVDRARDRRGDSRLPARLRRRAVHWQQRMIPQRRRRAVSARHRAGRRRARVDSAHPSNSCEWMVDRCFMPPVSRAVEVAGHAVSVVLGAHAADPRAAAPALRRVHRDQSGLERRDGELDSRLAFRGCRDRAAA